MVVIRPAALSCMLSIFLCWQASADVQPSNLATNRYNVLFLREPMLDALAQLQIEGGIDVIVEEGASFLTSGEKVSVCIRDVEPIPALYMIAGKHDLMVRQPNPDIPTFYVRKSAPPSRAGESAAGSNKPSSRRQLACGHCVLLAYGVLLHCSLVFLLALAIRCRLKHGQKGGQV